MNYNDQYAGMKLVSNGRGFVVTSYKDNGTTYDVNAGYSVELSGWFERTSSSVVWLQLTNGYYAYYDESEQDNGGWSAVEAAKGKSVTEASKLVNALIANNKKIVENNLLCARFADRLTAAERKAVKQLQQRVQERDAALRQSNVLTSRQEATPQGYSALSPYLTKLDAQVSGIGSVTIAIIVAVVVVASLATAAYYLYKYYYDQSVADVKYSDQLTKTLTSKLTEEEYQQLLKETNGILTKAVIKTKFSSFGAGAKAMIVAAAVVLAVPMVQKIAKEYKK